MITLRDFLKNPMGRQSAQGARRDMIIENLNNRYIKIIKTRTIKYDVYSRDNDYFIHLVVPSEFIKPLEDSNKRLIERMTYDVVLQIIDGASLNSSYTINLNPIKVFSNSPNFMFTYAYVINMNDDLIDFLKSKISDTALRIKPSVRNPVEELGFEKSIYFSLLFLKEMNLNVKSNLAKYKNNKLNEEMLLSKIDHSEEKLRMYNLYKKQQAEEKRREKAIKKKEKINASRNASKRRNFSTRKK